MTRRWSMRTRFVAAASLCLLPLLGVIFYILDQSLSNSRDQLYETEVAFAEVVSRGINQTLQENQDVLTSLAANPAISSMDQAQADVVLAQAKELRPSLAGLFLLDPQQQVVTYSGGINPADFQAEIKTAADIALTAGESAITGKLVVAGGGVEGKAWMQRLAKINWEKGDGQRGAPVYQQRACAACHDGSRRLGPSLAGITARFSREDLFLHIVDPNLSISPTYLAQEITLKDGTVHLGVPVYQSAAAVLLETGLGGTVRLSGDQIQSSAPARQSPMPEGLLNGASDAELADLYAYLQTLTLPK